MSPLIFKLNFKITSGNQLKLSIQQLASPNLRAVLPSCFSTAQHSLCGVWYLSMPSRITPQMWTAAPIPSYFLLPPGGSVSLLLIFKQEKPRNASALQTHFCKLLVLHVMRECSCIPAPRLRNHEYSIAGFDVWHRSGKGKGSQKVDRKNQCSDIHYHLVSPFYGRGYNAFLL